MSFSFFPPFPISSPSDSAYFWFEQAKDYYESSLVLYHSPSSHKHLPIITLQAFSLECVFKSLLSLNSIKFDRIHKLLTLFQLLPVTIQEDFKALCFSTHDLNLVDALTELDNYFVDSRYSHEKLNTTFVQKSFSSGWLQAINTLLIDAVKPQIPNLY